MLRPRALLALAALVLIVTACDRCPQSIWRESLSPIQGTAVAPFSGYPATTAEAGARALDAVARAVQQGTRSWEGDPDGEERSYTWDLVAMTAALRGIPGKEASFQQALAELLGRELPGGAWPTLTFPKTAGDQTPPTAGHAVSAAALALLEDLRRDGVKAKGLEERLTRGAAWLEAAWQADGALPINPGSDRLSTEVTALATLAGLALMDRLPWAGPRAQAGAQLLAGPLWQQDHFIRGLSGPQRQPDLDTTGPHTHSALAVLALVRGRAQLGESAPDPLKHDPTAWLLRHFSRTTQAGGVAVRGLGGRLALHDQDGLLYGCSGGAVDRQDGALRLTCPAEEIRSAEPIVCASPYNPCANPVESIPPGAQPVQAVDARVTLLGAMAARALGHTDKASTLLQAVLAMQVPGGGVIEVAGPARSAPDSALRYPYDHRLVQYGSTALLALALAGESPFTLRPPGALPPTPLDIRPPAAAERKLQVQELGLLPEPSSGWVAAPGSDQLQLQALTRAEGWVLWSSPPRGDLTVPAACWRLRLDASGQGPWDTLQLRATGADGLAYGLNLPGVVASDQRRIDLPLARLGLLWSRAGHSKTSFLPQRFHLGVVALDAEATPGQPLLLRTRGLRLTPGDCLEGAPIRFQWSQVTPEGSNNRLPYLDEVTFKDQRALQVRYNIDQPEAWQRVVVQDRWNWSCAKALRLRYHTSERTPVQVVLEDDQLGSGYSQGARFYVEGTLTPSDDWMELRVDINALRPFDPKDLRLLDGRRLRKLAIALPRTHNSPSSGKVTLLSLEALADQEDLREGGVCR